MSTNLALSGKVDRPFSSLDWPLAKAPPPTAKAPLPRAKAPHITGPTGPTNDVATATANNVAAASDLFTSAWARPLSTVLRGSLLVEFS